MNVAELLGIVYIAITGSGTTPGRRVQGDGCGRAVVHHRRGLGDDEPEDAGHEGAPRSRTPADVHAGDAVGAWRPSVAMTRGYADGCRRLARTMVTAAPRRKNTPMPTNTIAGTMRQVGVEDEQLDDADDDPHDADEQEEARDATDDDRLVRGGVAGFGCDGRRLWAVDFEPAIDALTLAVVRGRCRERRTDGVRRRGRNGTLAAHAVLGKLSWAMRSEAGPVRERNEDFATRSCRRRRTTRGIAGRCSSSPTAWAVTPRVRSRAASRSRRRSRVVDRIAPAAPTPGVRTVDPRRERRGVRRVDRTGSTRDGHDDRRAHDRRSRGGHRARRRQPRATSCAGPSAPS